MRGTARTNRLRNTRAPPPPPPPPLDDFAVSLLESGATLRIVYADGWTHRLAVRPPGPPLPAELFARRELEELLRAPVDVYVRRSAAEAQKTVAKQAKEHGRVTGCEAFDWE